MFCAGRNFLSQPKNLTAFSASSKTFVPAQKPILLNANHLYVGSPLCLAQNVCDCHNMYLNKFLVWHKKFGAPQNILGPVKGQGQGIRNWKIISTTNEFTKKNKFGRTQDTTIYLLSNSRTFSKLFIRNILNEFKRTCQMTIT